MLYNQYNEGFSNGDYEELDKVAHAMNNKKKGAYRDAKNNRKKFASEMEYGINSFNNVGYTCPTYGNNVSQYGDYVNGLPSSMALRSNDNLSVLSSNASSNASSNVSSFVDDASTDIASVPTFASASSLPPSSLPPLPSDVESDISSCFSSLSKKMKRNIRSKSPHLKKYSETDDDLVSKHLRKCKECEKTAKSILRKESAYSQTQTNNVPPQPQYQQPPQSQPQSQSQSQSQQLPQSPPSNNTFFGLQPKELKEIILIIIIGIIVIICCDMFLR